MWIFMEGLSVEEGIQIRSGFPDRIPLAKTFDQMIVLVTESFLPKTSTRCSRDDYLQSHVTCMKPVADDKMLHLREVIISIANDEAFVMDETDVDFNFEDVEWKELYVHMACSRMRKEAYGKSFDSRKVHVLLMLAASAADRDSLQRLLGIDLAIDKLNIGCDRFHGVLPLAAAVDSNALPINYCVGEDTSRRFDRFLHCNDFMSIALLEKELDKRHAEADKNIASRTLHGLQQQEEGSPSMLRMLLDMQISHLLNISFRLQLIHQKPISAGRAPTPIDMNCRELV
ncbi:unnamed protein product [Sphagnum jensenii]